MIEVVVVVVVVWHTLEKVSFFESSDEFSMTVRNLWHTHRRLKTVASPTTNETKGHEKKLRKE